MSAQQTPSLPSIKRQNKALRRSWSNKNTLNISRKVLEKSVIQQNKHIESIQQNNIQLARKVSELQKELSERNAELQVSREETFQLQMKLNRLQNNSAESTLYALREKLASMTGEMFRAHELASRICSELALPQASPFPGSTPFSRRSNDSMPMTSSVTVLPGEDEGVRRSNDATLRPSAQSVEMEFDSFGLVSNSVSYPAGRETMVLPPGNEEAAAGNPPTPFQTRESAPPTPLQTMKSSPSKQSIPSCPNDGGEDYVPGPKLKRKRVAATKKVEKATGAADISSVAEPAESDSSKAAVFHHLPFNHQPTESHLLTACVLTTVPLNQPEMDLKQGGKNEEEVGEAEPPEPKNPPRRQSKRRRKRLRLITDDSVFIPITDSMMEDAVAGNRNIEKPEQKGKEVGENVEVKRSTSLVDEQGSDPPTSPIRARRKTGSVSYVVKLNTQLIRIGAGEEPWALQREGPFGEGVRLGAEEEAVRSDPITGHVDGVFAEGATTEGIVCVYLARIDCENDKQWTCFVTLWAG
ncbi:hypothetical protein EGR_03929 [Echinococcus granulosus]|uniref:Uncharacterized protein n=1 Tax=Echinococcus granulosus TaxID=6210 RepID=W6V4W6_ECHGR|nr:hypothetical protein EGR_03929 [Echinococcus granulosus]EUB61254.1 hypothetical protein EGR_03929 [Echinococcus granulosus]